MSFERPRSLCSEMAAPLGRIVCDVGALRADAVGLEALARLQLGARRLGLEIELQNASSELLELLAFAGLSEVLRPAKPLRLEACGEAEEWEERLGVEEERELDDPAG